MSHVTTIYRVFIEDDMERADDVISSLTSGLGLFSGNPYDIAKHLELNYGENTFRFERVVPHEIYYNKDIYNNTRSTINIFGSEDTISHILADEKRNYNVKKTDSKHHIIVSNLTTEHKLNNIFEKLNNDEVTLLKNLIQQYENIGV